MRDTSKVAWNCVVLAAIFGLITAMLWPFFQDREHSHFQPSNTDYFFFLVFPVSVMLLIMGAIGIWRHQEWARRMVDIHMILLMALVGIFLGLLLGALVIPFSLFSLIVLFFLVMILLGIFSLRVELWKDAVIVVCGEKVKIDTPAGKKARFIRMIITLGIATIVGIVLVRFSYYI